MITQPVNTALHTALCSGWWISLSPVWDLVPPQGSLLLPVCQNTRPQIPFLQDIHTVGTDTHTHTHTLRERDQTSLSACAITGFLFSLTSFLSFFGTEVWARPTWRFNLKAGNHLRPLRNLKDRFTSRTDATRSFARAGSSPMFRNKPRSVSAAFLRSTSPRIRGCSIYFF